MHIVHGSQPFHDHNCRHLKSLFCIFLFTFFSVLKLFCNFFPGMDLKTFMLCSFIDSDSIELLELFTKDPEPIVSQSCEVALSMLEYERSGKSFEVKWRFTLTNWCSACINPRFWCFQNNYDTKFDCFLFLSCLVSVQGLKCKCISHWGLISIVLYGVNLELVHCHMVPWPSGLLSIFYTL
jgi:hypothetical protein